MLPLLRPLRLPMRDGPSLRGAWTGIEAAKRLAKAATRATAAAVRATTAAMAMASAVAMAATAAAASTASGGLAGPASTEPLAGLAAQAPAPGRADVVAGGRTDIADDLRRLLSNPQAPALAPGLYLQSTVTDMHAQGQVLARLPVPLSQARAALRSPRSWCLLLMLHPNVWDCEVPAAGPSRTVLQMLMGQQRVAVIGTTHRLTLAWTLARDDDAGLWLELMAEQGPMGTRDYRISARIEALDDTHSALELRFSNAFTRAGLWLAELYVNTAGRNRIGFTIERLDAEGRPVHVRGLRGSVERNTMRFHLAVQSWLAVQPLPAAQRIPRALEAWFDGSERHAAQLHEVEREEYLQMKREQYARRLAPEPTGQAPAPGSASTTIGRGERL